VHTRRRASFRFGPLGWPFLNTHKQNESNEMRRWELGRLPVYLIRRFWLLCIWFLTI
jgi:hypothetical protein